ncbi:MAG: hypothetical protein P8M17_05820 [Saprospiraceae bacterium]|jgi:phosphoribosylanthranilate isomerase|nr:hypothetical protein [Saprospiraceae bacterium]MDG1432630.1 hypothetical protein [Saprospiraceae bacterium]MDG2418488.1 hypothetical protein [Saprospiraceae bacterium]
MLKIKIKASQITNLTDARYFAAWEVEWLGFNFDQGTEHYILPQNMKAIKEWVEGVKMVGEFSFATAEDINEAVELLELHTVQVGMFTEVPVLKKITAAPVIKEVVISPDVDEVSLKNHLEQCAPHVEYFLLSFEKSGTTWEMLKNGESQIGSVLLKKLCAKYKIILSINLSQNSLDEILSIPNLHALNVTGGEEEKVGVKSFDELDEIFETLEILV